MAQASKSWSLAAELATAEPPDDSEPYYPSQMDGGWQSHRTINEINSHQRALKKLDAMLDEARRLRRASLDLADDFIGLSSRVKTLKGDIKDFGYGVKAFSAKNSIERFLSRTNNTLDCYGEGIQLAVYYVDAPSCCSVMSVGGRSEQPARRLKVKTADRSTASMVELKGGKYRDTNDLEGFFARSSVSDSFIL